MPDRKLSSTEYKRSFPKAPTGIVGLDDLTGGGLPQGRPTLICGSPGSGKTLFGMEFLVRGARQYNEPGVFIAFEETTEELAQNSASLGFDLDALIAAKQLDLDCIEIDRSETEETGTYDLDGLFIRLGHAIDSIGAKRVVLDTLEVLFATLDNEKILRAELRRLFRWLKAKGVTAVITAEQGNGALTRYGIEEYVSDCVILLDNRMRDQISTRRLRIIKYRGSVHGTNEYPFLIDAHGFSVLPITSVGLHHSVSAERISTGVDSLDQMLGGQGYFRGSSVLISGTAGTGKSSLSAHFVNAACQRGERCLYFALEESTSQIIRNMRSIGLDLQPWVNQNLLLFHAARPTFQGLELHLTEMQQLIREFQPQVVVIDPITNFSAIGSLVEVKSMLMRLVDYLKSEQITSLFTSLTDGGSHLEQTDIGISSLIDTWLLVRDIELNGERNRGLYVLKSRGMPHSNQIREFLITDHGVVLLPVYMGPRGAIIGSARGVQAAQEQAKTLLVQQEVDHKREALERKRKALEAQVAAQWAAFEAEAVEVNRLLQQEAGRAAQLHQDDLVIAHTRTAKSSPPTLRRTNRKGRSK